MAASWILHSSQNYLETIDESVNLVSCLRHTKLSRLAPVDCDSTHSETFDNFPDYSRSFSHAWGSFADLITVSIFEVGLIFM
jgi:hypothetical protein